MIEIRLLQLSTQTHSPNTLRTRNSLKTQTKGVLGPVQVMKKTLELLFDRKIRNIIRLSSKSEMSIFVIKVGSGMVNW